MFSLPLDPGNGDSNGLAGRLVKTRRHPGDSFSLGRDGAQSHPGQRYKSRIVAAQEELL
jgi:hypothetical protein